MPVMTTLTAAQITALPTLPPYRMGQPRVISTQAVEVIDGYQMVITPTGHDQWAVDLYDAANTQLRDSKSGLNCWPAVELAMWEMVAIDQHRQAGVCIWEADTLQPCMEVALPGRDCCVEHDHASVMRTFAYQACSVTCRCGQVFSGETAEEAFGLHVLHAIAEVPSLETREPIDVVAEMQRQLAITIAAEEAAEARGEQVPLSGMPGFETWKRRVLAAAGETYTIIRGERVPLDA